MVKPSVVSRTGAAQVTDQKYEVTGELTPDATGTYLPIGPWNDKPAYELASNGWYIWWDGVDAWMITATLGVVAGPIWDRTDPNIVGNYVPLGGAVGIATVTEI